MPFIFLSFSLHYCNLCTSTEDKLVGSYSVLKKSLSVLQRNTFSMSFIYLFNDLYGPHYVLGASQMIQWQRILLTSGRLRFISGWGRSPGEGNGNPLQYPCLGNPMDRVWQAIVHGVSRVWDLTQQLNSNDNNGLDSAPHVGYRYEQN